LRRFFLAALAVFFLVSVPDVQAEIRALWVTRWDYKTEQDVVSIMTNAATHGFNAVLFQVRGDGTVHYPSKIEPWTWQLTGDSPAATGNDPAWDPLAVAIREAENRKLQIHAYMNVLPGWRGEESPPKESGQVWATHPEWFMVDLAGKRMRPCKSWYTFLSPHHPEARAHLKRLFAEVAAQYKVDGIHLDYFRFPSDYPAEQAYGKLKSAELAKHKDFSYDKTALEQFKTQTGKTPTQNADAWNRFRCGALTDLLREIRSAALKENPSLVLSCAVLADPDKGKETYFQDSALWLREGLMDLVFPMNYYRKSFDSNLKKYCDTVGEQRIGRVATGISLEQPVEELRREIALIRKQRTAGMAFFAYSSIFKNHAPTKTAKTLKTILAGTMNSE